MNVAPDPPRPASATGEFDRPTGEAPGEASGNIPLVRLALRRYVEPESGETAAKLPGGNLTVALVRVGNTVRRSPQRQSLAVADYLDHLQRVGFDAAPAFLGRDALGRDVLTFIEGDVPADPPPAWAASDVLLASVARLLRRLHDASEGYAADRGFAALPGTVWRKDLVKVDLPEPEPPPELISHLDVVPSNVVVRKGEAVAFIDFELAGPTTRMLNLYTTAVHWVPLCAAEDIPPAWADVDQASRLRLFADAYGLCAEQRMLLPDFGIMRAGTTWRRMRASAEQLGGGWARMWKAGAGDVILRRRDWLVDVREELLDALE